jgi:hypothetical protein
MAFDATMNRESEGEEGTKKCDKVQVIVSRNGAAETDGRVGRSAEKGRLADLRIASDSNTFCVGLNVRE